MDTKCDNRFNSLSYFDCKTDIDRMIYLYYEIEQ